MEAPALHLVQGPGRSVDGKQKLVLSRRRRTAVAKISRKQALGSAQTGWRDGKGDGSRVWSSCPGQHRRAIERENAHTFKGVVIRP